MPTHQNEIIDNISFTSSPIARDNFRDSFGSFTETPKSYHRQGSEASLGTYNSFVVPRQQSSVSALSPLSRATSRGFDNFMASSSRPTSFNRQQSGENQPHHDRPASSPTMQVISNPIEDNNDNEELYNSMKVS